MAMCVSNNKGFHLVNRKPLTKKSPVKQVKAEPEYTYKLLMDNVEFKIKVVKE